MMLQLTQTSDSAFAIPRTYERRSFVFVGERLWLDFVNTELGARGEDALRDFESMLRWLEAAAVLDEERGVGIRRRAVQQPSGALAALNDAVRVRGVLRLLAERGLTDDEVLSVALLEINRVLGRSAGTRRVDVRTDGTFTRSFVPVGDAFAGLVMPIIESAADALISGRAGARPAVQSCALSAGLLRHDEERPPQMVRHGHVRQPGQGGAPSDKSCECPDRHTHVSRATVAITASPRRDGRAGRSIPPR